MKISEFCRHLDARLAALPSEERLAAVDAALRKAFRLREGEVAILSLDPEREVLAFLWPKKLQRSGLVPLSSPTSLAARTARENQTFVHNRFASAPHASIFERVDLDKAASGASAPIQKILSAPLPGEGYVKGVVQLSRKGTDAAAAGADFSQVERAALVEIAQVLARHL